MHEDFVLLNVDMSSAFSVVTSGGASAQNPKLSGGRAAGAGLRGVTRMRVEGIGTKSRHVSRQNMTVVVVECTQAGDRALHHHVRSSRLVTLRCSLTKIEFRFLKSGQP